MTNNETVVLDDRDIFLTKTEVFARYGWKRSSGYEYIRQRGFPRALPGGVYCLAHLRQWDSRYSSDNYEVFGATTLESAPCPETEVKAPSRAARPASRSTGRKRSGARREDV